MVIRRSDIQNLTSIESVFQLFNRMGYSDHHHLNNTEGRISLSDDSLESLLIILINSRSEIPQYIKKIDGIETIYLSLITKDFEKFTFVKKDFTVTGTTRYRKFSFEKSRISNSTLKKFNSLVFGDLASFEKLFDKTEVVKEFYREFISTRNILIHALNGLLTEKMKINYSQTLFNRLIFLFFIQKKQLLDHNVDYLEDKLSFCNKNKKNFYSTFLKPLFFQALSVSHFNNPLFGQIPYLNGGLFRKTQIETNFKNLSIPNEVFSSIFDFFNSYNWYVDESADFGEEKGISPEILGHIFEQTINAISDSGNGQNEKGAYYTPEIVTKFIAEQTILSYILDKINSHFNIHLVTIQDILNEQDKIKLCLYIFLELLPDLYILDNACGSGAFLLTTLNTLKEIYTAVLYHIINQPKIKNFIGDYLKNNNQKPDWFKWIFPDLDSFSKNHRWQYYIKKSIIIRNLYGVDIEPGATEIAKLRLWLAMMSEIGSNYSDIEPLPNIEFNIRCGNSIIGFTRLPSIVSIDDFLKIPEIEQKFEILENNSIAKTLDIKKMKELVKSPTISNITKIKNMLLNSFKLEVENHIHQSLHELIDEINSVLNEEMNKRYLTIVNSKLTKKKQISYNQFIEMNPFHWVIEFSEILQKKQNPGFDILIGNPPYGNLLSKTEKIICTANKIVVREIAGAFVERSIKLQKMTGCLSYIITYAINFNKSLSQVRNKIFKNYAECRISTYDRDKCRFFEGVTQSVSIMLCKEKLKSSNCKFYTTKMYRSMPNLSNIQYGNANQYLLSDQIGGLFKEPHRLPKIGDKISLKILKKILGHNQPKNLISCIGDLIGSRIQVKTVDDINSISLKPKYILWIRSSGNYWYNAWDHHPYFSSEVKYVKITDKTEGIKEFLLILINSSFFYYWFRIFGDGRHMNSDIMNILPLPSNFYKILKEKSILIRNSSELLINTMFSFFDSSHNRFLSSTFKPILDYCDEIIGYLYGLTDEEIKYLQNYESKIRKGIQIDYNLKKEIKTLLDHFSTDKFNEIKKKINNRIKTL